MKRLESALLVSLIVIWLAIVFKYETIAFLSHRSRSDSSNTRSDSSHRVRQSISNTYHRVADKISDKLDSRSRHNVKPAPVPAPVPKPAPAPVPPPVYPKPAPIPAPPPVYPQPAPAPAPPPVYPKPGSSNPISKIGDKLKTGGGFLALSGLAKKILSSGRHKGGHHNYHSGLYHNYNYRPDRYSYVKGDTCYNNVNYDGIVYGQFICPIEGFDYTATKCCGNMYEQYCCTPAEAYGYNSYNNPSNNDEYYRKKSKNSSGLAGLAVVLVIAFILLLIGVGIALILIYRRRTA